MDGPTCLKNDNFRYSRLPSDGGWFRLLTLHAGSGDEPVRCSLFETTLDSGHEYEAISYTWGSPEDTERVFLGGHEHVVRRNLHDVLKAVRHVDRDRTLWTDALCIEQDSVEDKNMQVPLIGDIFRDATSVLVWLGQESTFVDAVLKSDSRRLDPARLRGFLDNLSSRAYWTRAWITQEFIIGKRYRVMWADCELADDEFERAFVSALRVDPLHESAWPELPHQVHYPTSKLSRSRLAMLVYLRHKYKEQKFDMFWDTLAFNIHSHCSDIRDKIFSLTTLHESNKRRLSIDYRSDHVEIFWATLSALPSQDLVRDARILRKALGVSWAYICANSAKVLRNRRLGQLRLVLTSLGKAGDARHGAGLTSFSAVPLTNVQLSSQQLSYRFSFGKGVAIHPRREEHLTRPGDEFDFDVRPNTGRLAGTSSLSSPLPTKTIETHLKTASSATVSHEAVFFGSGDGTWGFFVKGSNKPDIVAGARFYDEDLEHNTSGPREDQSRLCAPFFDPSFARAVQRSLKRVGSKLVLTVTPEQFLVLCMQDQNPDLWEFSKNQHKRQKYHNVAEGLNVDKSTQVMFADQFVDRSSRAGGFVQALNTIDLWSRSACSS